MKIIAVGMNYALHNKELGHTHENKEPVIFLKPDSAILKDGKPFFIPDFPTRYIMRRKWWCASAVWARILLLALPIAIMMR